MAFVLSFVVWFEQIDGRCRNNGNANPAQRAGLSTSLFSTSHSILYTGLQATRTTLSLSSKSRVWRTRMWASEPTRTSSVRSSTSGRRSSTPRSAQLLPTRIPQSHAAHCSVCRSEASSRTRLLLPSTREVWACKRIARALYTRIHRPQRKDY